MRLRWAAAEALEEGELRRFGALRGGRAWPDRTSAGGRGGGGAAARGSPDSGARPDAARLATAGRGGVAGRGARRISSRASSSHSTWRSSLVALTFSTGRISEYAAAAGNARFDGAELVVRGRGRLLLEDLDAGARSQEERLLGLRLDGILGRLAARGFLAVERAGDEVLLCRGCG